MKLLSKMTIKARMIFAFGVFVLISAGFGVFSLNRMNTLGELTQILYNHPLRVSNAALSASTGVLKMHRSMKDVTLARSDFGRNEAIQNVRSEEAGVYEQLDIIRQYILGVDGKTLEKETRLLFVNWKSIRDEVIDLVKEGNKEAAALITRKKGADHVALLEAKMLELTTYARSKADGFMIDAKLKQKDIIRLTIGVIVLAVLFSCVLAYWMITSILSSVTELQDTMSEISRTGKLVKSEMTGQNEITVMGAHFNVLIDMLEKQLWLREGLNQLTDALSGDISYSDLVGESINFVSRYIDACAGALYKYNKETEVCELTASFAFVERKYISNQFKIGEGIVGQVAIEKKPILLKNITREEAVGHTGTVSEPPKHIYAVPLSYEQELYGVLEVASFEAITETKIEFLNAASQNISTFLYTASQNEQIKILLEETQNANESLQARTDEVNDANEKLTALNEELQAQSKELQAQASELEAQKAELETQRQQVEEADRLKSEFLSNMSHELRTPLNSVLALSQLMISKGTGKDPQQETQYLQVIERNGRQLLSLINDILDLSKIEAGRMDLYITDFYPGEIIQRALETIQPLVEEKGLKTIVNVPDTPAMHSDEEKVTQILLNLFSNALKFTDQGEIEITLTESKGIASLDVRDTGIGISPEDKSNIFDEFRQVDGSTTRAHEGTGLGLAICQKLAHLLGGEITVTSAIGEGSTFTLKLPIQIHHGQEAKPKDKVLKAKTHEVTIPSGQTILIIDDDAKACEMLRRYLTEAGYQVEVAHRGKEGLELARRLKPFAITLDILMPGMDGWEVIRELKSHKETENIPIIILTAKDLTREDRVRLKDAANHIVLKGVMDQNTLLQKIEIELANIRTHDISNILEEKSLILVVEDNEVAALQIRTALEENGYRVHVATGGMQAIEFVHQHVPHAVILDLMMPEVDGFKVLEEIRSTPRTATLPVLILTAKELTSADRERLSYNNVQQLIQKGAVDRNQLVNSIKNILSPGKTLSDRTDEKTIQIEKKPTLRGELPTKNEMILVVEDNPDNLMTMDAILKDESYAIITARDGKEAVRVASEFSPALILMDVQLPGLSGIEATRQIKANPDLSGIPIVAVTAKAMRRDREKILAAGCNDYLSKPIDPSQLIAVIKKWMN